MPHFLFTGRLDQWVHQQTDAFRADHPDVEVRVADVLGPCDELAQVVVQRYREGALRARTTTGSPAYLTGLLLRGRKVVVVGGGCVARRRVPKLLDAGAVVELVSPQAHSRLAGLAAAGAITWHARDFRPSDLDGAWYVLALTDSAQTNGDGSRRGGGPAHLLRPRRPGRRGFGVDAGDRRHAGMTVAAITSHDPLRARRVRDRFIELVNQESL